ncbi:MAG: molybdate ABC transporter substrate-binding protein [Devosiaceae bacterium]
MRTLLAAMLLGLMVMPLRAEPLTVFAAASLKNAFDTIGDAFTQDTGVEVVVSYAGTSVLARQIELGAPADIFASANDAWTHYLVQQGALDASSNYVFARNSLVLIAPQNTELNAPVDLASAEDLLAELGEDGRLAVALVDAVPAGIYAREAMENLGLWSVLEPRLAQADNVRAALRLVALGEAPLGIVYASDAQADESVVVAAEIPPSSHSVIRYTASRVAETGMDESTQFLRFLNEPEAQAILRSEDFLPPTGRSTP